MDFTDSEQQFLIKLLEEYKQEHIDDESNWTDLIDGILRKLNGDMVLKAPNDLNTIFTKDATKKLWEFANNNHNDVVQRIVGDVKKYPWMG